MSASGYNCLYLVEIVISKSLEYTCTVVAPVLFNVQYCREGSLHNVYLFNILNFFDPKNL